MQPPPRKGNYAKFLKALHAEQVAKLQAKHQHECDLLDDIRNYTLKRSAIEKSYSEALLKISSAFLNRKIPNIPDIKCEGSEEKWNMWNVWRTVLEENEKLARARLAAVEVFHQQIADDAKVLRSHKVHSSRKAVDQLVVIQKELQTCVQDVDKTKKLYFDEEHSAHDVRDKARDIEEKLKKKKGSFFQSITSLQKNSAKVSSKREVLEEKSTGARNDYLLSLAAANAHQTRYFVVDFQQTMATMENNVYDKVAEYLTLIGRTELLTCTATQTSFGRIRDQAQQLTREYNLRCLHLFYPVLKQHIQYDFEPCDNDNVDTITADQPSIAAMLSKEAKRWANRIVRENNNIREYSRRLQIYINLRESGQKVDPNDQNGPDLETKIDETKQSIRRSETAKAKAEARLECLRAGGVNVDEWLQDVDNLSVQDMPRSTSSMSCRTDASGTGEPPSSDSFYDSDMDGGSEADRPISDSRDEDMEQQDGAEVDGEWALVEQERQRLEQLTAGWDDPTQADWGPDDSENVPPSTMSGSLADAEPASDTPVITDTTSGDSVPVVKCTALYNYTAQNPDELSILENEQLEVVGEGDGDGWLKARNYRGEEGYVPHNYLDLDQDQDQDQWGESQHSGIVTQISFSSVDYTVDETDEQITEMEVVPPDAPLPEQTADILPAETVHDLDETAQDDVSYCLALYDYEATCVEELSFKEGDIIRILRKRVHDDIDDGWWEGEFNGRTGLFPSLVTEECRADGEPVTPQHSPEPELPSCEDTQTTNLVSEITDIEMGSEEDLPSLSPPVFTPPEIPAFMLAPQHVIITQPTPVIGRSEEDLPKAVEDGNTESEGPSNQPAFSMELTRGRYKQYDTQFEEEDTISDNTPAVTVIEAPAISVETNGDCEPVPNIDTKSDQKVGGSSSKCSDAGTDFSLGVAQIVITAATPMTEEPEQPFPPPPTEDETYQLEDLDEVSEEPPPYEAACEESVTETPSVAEDTTVITEEIDDPADDLPTDSAPFPISSSSSEGDSYTGPSTAENSQSQPPPEETQEIQADKIIASSETPSKSDDVADDLPMEHISGAGMKGDIPDELEPHQLAQLQNLKESNA